MQTIGRLGMLALGTLLASVSLGGCKQKDAQACQNAQSVIRQALGSEDFASARQWRDYAYKQCDDKSQLDALDKEIVDKEAQVKQRKEQEEATKGRTDQLLKVFTEWAGQYKANPSGAAVAVTCTEPADAKKEKEHWCTRERTAGEFKLAVRYWEADPEIFEFSTTSPGTVTCESFGTATQLKSNHDGALVHCDLGGTLAGAQGLAIRTAAGTRVSIFSPKLLEHDASFKRRLDL